MEIQLAQTLHRAGLQHSNQAWEMAPVCSGRPTQKRLGLATWPASGEAVGQFREWLEGRCQRRCSHRASPIPAVLPLTPCLILF